MKSQAHHIVNALGFSLVILLVGFIATANAGPLTFGSEESSSLTIVFGSPAEFDQNQKIDLPTSQPNIVEPEDERMLSEPSSDTSQSFPVATETEMLTGNLSDPIVTFTSIPPVSMQEAGQDTAVPEPSTVFLLGMGALGIAALLKHKKTR